MKHPVFNLLEVASLLLSVAIAALWVRSYWTADGIEMQSATATIGALSNRGQLRLRHDTIDDVYAGDGGGPHGWRIGHLPAMIVPQYPVGPGVRWDYRLPGFSWRARSKGSVKTGPITGSFWWAYWEAGIPHPAIVLLLLVLPAIAIRRIRREKRRELGLCAVCGYDLRATADRCPECGTAKTR